MLSREKTVPIARALFDFATDAATLRVSANNFVRMY